MYENSYDEMSKCPRVPEWIVAAVLFAGGIACRIALDGIPTTILFQSLAFGSGLPVLAKWWLRSGDVDGRGMLGCVALLVLAIASAMAIITSINR